MKKIYNRLLFTLRAIKHFFLGEKELKYIYFNFEKSNSIALDIGGNNGVYSYWLSKKYSKVHVFEPNYKLAEKLEMLDLKYIKVFNTALSNSKYSAYLNIPFDGLKYNAGLAYIANKKESPQSYLIETDYLDNINYINNNVGLIKIDVEGHEFEILKGGIFLIKKFRPILIIEIEERHSPGNIEVISKYLKKINYNGYYINDIGILNNIELFDKHIFQDINRLGTKKYINNFIFMSNE